MSKHVVGPETVFISHVHEDADFARRLAADLRANGVDVWIDTDIDPGEPWDEAIEHAIRAAGKMIVVLSPRSVASREVTNEWSFAIDDGDLVLPLVLEACEVPFRLRRLQRVEIGTDYERALAEILARLSAARVGTLQPLVVSAPPSRRYAPVHRVRLPAVAFAGVAALGLAVAGAWKSNTTSLGGDTSQSDPKGGVADAATASCARLGDELINDYRTLMDSRSRKLSTKGQWLAAAESYGKCPSNGVSAATLRRHKSAAQFCRGMEDLLVGALDKAENEWRDATTLDDEWAPPFIQLSVVLTRLGRYSEAHDAARKALGSEPDFWLANGASGSIYAAEGKMRDAISAFETALGKSDAPLLKGNLALAFHAARQNDDRAKQLAEEALKIDDTLPSALTVLAERALEGGDLEKALAHSQTLVDSALFDVAARLLFGDVLLALGRTEEAHKAYEEALSDFDSTRQLGAPLERLAEVRRALDTGTMPSLRNAARSAPPAIVAGPSPLQSARTVDRSIPRSQPHPTKPDPARSFPRPEPPPPLQPTF